MSSVPNTVNQFGFDPLQEYLPSRPWLDVVDYEIEVPMDYWVTGNSIEPHKTLGRVNQLMLFRKLYHAQYEGFVRADGMLAFHAYHTKHLSLIHI